MKIKQYLPSVLSSLGLGALAVTAVLVAVPALAAPVAGPEIVVPAGPGCPVTEPMVANAGEHEIWTWDKARRIEEAVFDDRETEPDLEDTLVDEPSLYFVMADNREVAWVAYGSFATGTIEVRQVGAAGGAAPSGSATLTPTGNLAGIRLAVAPDGSVLVVWRQVSGSFNPIYTTLAQHLDPSGALVGERFLLEGAGAGELRLAALANSSYVAVLHRRDPLDRILAYRVARGGEEFVGPEVIAEDQVTSTTVVNNITSAADVAPWPGGFAVAWKGEAAGSYFLAWRLYDFNAQPVTPRRISTGGAFSLDAATSTTAPLLASAPDGRLALVWTHQANLAALLTDSMGEVQEPPFAVEDSSGVSRNPDLAFDREGVLTVVWDQGPIQEATPPLGCRGFGTAIHGRRFVASGCAAGALCLLDDRFEVTVAWDDPFNGGSGVGRPVPLTDDTGAFWFFEANNLELMVKVLDGRVINDHFWVFYGSLTNVAFDLTVTDRVTGERRVYTNPPEVFASEGDTTAFSAPPGSGLR